MFQKIIAFIFWGCCISTIFAQTFSFPIQNTPSNRLLFAQDAPEDAKSLVFDQIVQGNVVSNHEFDEICQKLASELKADNADLPETYRFFIWKTTEVQPIAIKQTGVLVPLGLLAKVENESQLAFLVVKSLLQLNEATNTTKLFSSATSYTLGTIPNTSAKELELNKKAFLCLQKTGFNPYEILPFLDDLAGLSGEAEMPKSFFETSNLRFPNRYWLQTTEKIVAISDKREQLVAEIEGNLGQLTKKRNRTIGENVMKEIAESAQLETVQQFLHQGKYEQAINLAYQNLDNGSINTTFKKMIGKALYGITKSRNYTTDSTIIKGLGTNYKKQVGELQRIYYVLERMQNNELNVVTADYLWRLRKLNPQDAELIALSKDAVQELVDFHYEKTNDFSNKPFDGIDSLNWAKYAFVDYLADTSFTNLFKKARAHKETDKRIEVKETKLAQKGKSKRTEQEMKGARMGVMAVTVVQPQTNFAELKHAQWFEETFNSSIQKTEIKANILTAKLVGKTETVVLNEVAALNQWVEEQQNKNYYFISTQQQVIWGLMQKYNTDHFLWLKMTTEKAPNKLTKTIGRVVKGILIPSYLPAAILSGKNITTEASAIVYNLKTNNKTVIKDFKITQPINRSFFTSQLYDIFLQIKAKN